MAIAVVSGKIISTPDHHSPWGIRVGEMLPVRRSLCYVQRRSHTLHSVTIAFEGHLFNIVDHPSVGIRTRWKFRHGSGPGSSSGSGATNNVSIYSGFT